MVFSVLTVYLLKASVVLAHAHTHHQFDLQNHKKKRNVQAGTVTNGDRVMCVITIQTQHVKEALCSWGKHSMVQVEVGRPVLYLGTHTHSHIYTQTHAH